MGGAFVVAAIAALASYSHMRAAALAYGQPELIADLLPISVEGMMATATAALGDGRRYPLGGVAGVLAGVVASVVANVLAAEPSLVAPCISAWPAIAFVLVVEVITRAARPATPKQSATSTARRSLAQTRELAAQLRAQHPQITQTELARRLGISATRLRRVDKVEVRPELSRPINHSDETRSKRSSA